jgi:hypothetical protein
MSSNLATRKTVYKLTRDDFASYPIWEWAIGEEGAEGQDESFVRPTAFTSIPKSDFAQFVVAADSKLRKGTVMPACAEVTVRDKQVSIHPMSVLLYDRHLDIAGMETTRLLSRLTQEVDNYPVSWVLKVPLDGEGKPRQGRVPRSLLLQLIALWRRLKIARQPSAV